MWRHRNSGVLAPLADRRETTNANAGGEMPARIETAMTDEDDITLDDIEREASIARIFGQYAAYVKSLPLSVWAKGENGWVGKSR